MKQLREEINSLRQMHRHMQSQEEQRRKMVDCLTDLIEEDHMEKGMLLYNKSTNCQRMGQKDMIRNEMILTGSLSSSKLTSGIPGMNNDSPLEQLCFQINAPQVYSSSGHDNWQPVRSPHASSMRNGKTIKAEIGQSKRESDNGLYRTHPYIDDMLLEMSAKSGDQSNGSPKRRKFGS